MPRSRLIETLMFRSVVFTSGLLAMLFFTQAETQAGGGFEITLSTIDGGGGESTDEEFELVGTTGQHDASESSSSGGGYLLSGGFWAEPVKPEVIFSSGFESGPEILK